MILSHTRVPVGKPFSQAYPLAQTWWHKSNLKTLTSHSTAKAFSGRSTSVALVRTACTRQKKLDYNLCNVLDFFIGSKI